MPWHFVFLDKYALAVTDPAPFTSSWSSRHSARAEHDLQLKVKVGPACDFQKPSRCTDWLPSGVSKGATVTIPADKTEGCLRFRRTIRLCPASTECDQRITTGRRRL